MALVEVTGNAWGHDRQPISPTLQPELFFRPLQSSMYTGLMSDREVKAALTTASGAFTVKLESQPGLYYVPVLRWLVSPEMSNETEQNRARQRDEWPPILPGNGGDISDLFDLTPYGPIVAALGKPPAGTQGIAWFDLTDSNSQGVMLYAERKAV